VSEEKSLLKTAYILHSVATLFTLCNKRYFELAYSMLTLCTTLEILQFVAMIASEEFVALNAMNQLNNCIFLW